MNLALMRKVCRNFACYCARKRNQSIMPPLMNLLRPDGRDLLAKGYRKGGAKNGF